jgi:hypothetical protein
MGANYSQAFLNNGDMSEKCCSMISSLCEGAAKL